MVPQNEYIRKNLMPKILPSLLERSIIKPNRVRLFDQGSLKDRAQAALDTHRENKVSGEKLVIKIDA